MVKRITEICSVNSFQTRSSQFSEFEQYCPYTMYIIHHSCQKGPPGSVTQCDSICTEMCKAFEEEWEGDKEA